MCGVDKSVRVVAAQPPASTGFRRWHHNSPFLC